ncbi:SDR family NAD(P)-dependent oxidoreductase [soil metagenome]
MWTQEDIVEQKGKVALVTGANSGIGLETAYALYEKGAFVLLACRRERSARQALQELKKRGGTGHLEIVLLDLSSLEAIRQVAQQITQRYPQLHLLINNAGVMTPPASQTMDGFELQLGVNFLGHFALTGYLYPMLARTYASRIVTLTSLAYQYGQLDVDNFKLEKPYDPNREYAQSKLADLVFTLELQRRIEAKGDHVLSLAAHPGVTSTGLSRYMSEEAYQAAVDQFGQLMGPAQGALSTLYAAVASGVVGGGFYGPDQDGGLRGYPGPTIIEANALEAGLGELLWNKAQQLTGNPFTDAKQVRVG